MKSLIHSLKLPVLVYFHGGAYITGSNDRYYEQPDYFVSQSNIIVVKPNYRFGPFGFWTASELDGTNFGILDQQLALEWTKNYISYFGGDANRITISGCSAGGQSVWIHLTHPSSVTPIIKGLDELGNRLEISVLLKVVLQWVLL